MMKLEKNGETIVLTNQSHIDAYLSAGWKEAAEPVKKTAAKSKKS